ncbi:MAG TPA: response regulator [Spirochaetia bacterium]|nr:response regulator [Spirochaetia bacterium]
MATVLVLDSDEITLSSLQDILASFGHEVLVARDQKSALEAVARRTIALFLFDLRLEGIDPVTLTQAVRERHPEVPVIAVTAYPREPLALAALDAGGHSLMRKPYEIGRILDLLGSGRP